MRRFAILSALATGCGIGPPSVTFVDDDGFADGRVVVTTSGTETGGHLLRHDDGLIVIAAVYSWSDDKLNSDQRCDQIVFRIAADGREDPDFELATNTSSWNACGAPHHGLVRGDGGIVVFGETRFSSLPESTAWLVSAAGAIDLDFERHDSVSRYPNLAGEEHAAVLLADGSVVLVGAPFGPDAIRIAADGGLTDLLFDDLEPAGRAHQWHSIFADDSGGYLVFGAEILDQQSPPPGMALVGRLTAAFAPDATFGPAGYAKVGTVEASMGDVIRLADGRFAAPTQAEGAVPAILVMTSAGDPDPAAGPGGVLPIAGSAVGDQIVELAPTPDGGLLVQAHTATGERVYRILADGSLDPSFGAGGWVEEPGLPFGVLVADGVAYAATQGPGLLVIRVLPGAY